MEGMEILPKADARVAKPEDRAAQSMRDALDAEGLDEKCMAKTLKHIIANAECATPKGQIIEDYASKLAAIKVWQKLRSSQPDFQVNVLNMFQKDRDF